MHRAQQRSERSGGRLLRWDNEYLWTAKKQHEVIAKEERSKGLGRIDNEYLWSKKEDRNQENIRKTASGRRLRISGADYDYAPAPASGRRLRIYGDYYDYAHYHDDAAHYAPAQHQQLHVQEKKQQRFINRRGKFTRTHH